MKFKNKKIGGRVQIDKVLLSITPKNGWEYKKKVLGTIVEKKDEYEQYYYTCSGGHTYVSKHIIENDCFITYAIKLDDDLVDIAGNNIIIVREWDLKFLEYLPKTYKNVTTAEYKKALKTIEKYKHEQSLI
jgi:hypothetical protein